MVDSHEVGRRREVAVLKDWISRCENDYYRTLDDMVAQMRTELLAIAPGAVGRDVESDVR